MTPAVDASDRCSVAWGKARIGERSGAPGAKSLLNVVEMKSDSPRGNSGGIRITRHLPEHFPRRMVSRMIVVSLLSPLGKPLMACRCTRQGGEAAIHPRSLHLRGFLSAFL